MKICFLAGANSVHSHKWVKYFAEKGHDVHWISFTKNTQGTIDRASFYQISVPFPFNFFKLRKIVKKINPDIFHAHYAGVNGFLASLCNVHPFVLTAWGSDVLIAGKSKFQSFFVKYALKKADLITCDGKNSEEAIVNLGINLKKIKMIYFGVDVLKFSPGQKSIGIIEKLEMVGCPSVISLRNFEPIYNIETLINAIPSVLKEVSKVKFILAGKGSQEENLKKLVKKLNISKSVNFVGLISQNDLPKYLRSCDVYVSTSLSDGGIASSTAEAMACGLPVVITNFGDNKEWVKDGESGFLVPLKTPDVLAEKIIYLLKNPEKRLELGINAVKIIEEKDNYYKEMEKMENIYKELIKK